jgi:hypothetical protein
MDWVLLLLLLLLLLVVVDAEQLLKAPKPRHCAVQTTAAAAAAHKPAQQSQLMAIADLVTTGQYKLTCGLRSRGPATARQNITPEPAAGICPQPGLT